MLDKTRLEHDIESREIFKTPLGVRIFITLLLIIICTIGLYSYKLKQNIDMKNEKIRLLKEDFKEETNKLLSKIKEYENRSGQLKSD